uniref:Uncharacterized protein n=1 Tax=Physcomitrium patens TaxID=3218 RepID=A0A2K1IEN9_PHYPA|nr:hypothetical protein PHYPA_029894 [Physcomitrium patens]
MRSLILQAGLRCTKRHGGCTARLRPSQPCETCGICPHLRGMPGSHTLRYMIRLRGATGPSGAELFLAAFRP